MPEYTSVTSMKHPSENFTILIFLILFLSITAVSGADPAVLYGSYTDRASSGDSRYIIKSTVNSSIWVFEKGNNSPIWSHNINREISSVAISPDNKYVAVGSGGGGIWLFDQKGAVVWNKTFGNAGIRSIEFSKDSQYLDASSFTNQAFYISIQGNPATRPLFTTVSETPPLTPLVSLAQMPGSPDLSWIESFFRNNLNLLIGIVIGLVLSGIAWYAVSRRRNRKIKSIPSVRNLISLRNFTIFSLLLILAGFLPAFSPFSSYPGILQTAYDIGIFCFLLAYFLYALKCWGSENKLWAVFMVSIPLLVYFLATSKIPDSTENILLDLTIRFCLYAIISAIILYACNIVKTGVEGIFSGRNHKSFRYSSPEISYAVAGVILVSFFMVNAGGAGIFNNNTGTVTQSFQKMIPSGTFSYNAGTSPSSVNSQNIPVPTRQPDIVKDIERSVGIAKPDIDISSLEMEIHTGINQQRRSNGLPPLSYDSTLASIARKHSEDMARNHYFSHNNLQGLDPSGRATRDGYSCYKDYGSYYTTGLAENIMQNNLYDSVTYYNGIPRYDWNSDEEIARSTVNGWMTSPGHRQNILTSTYDREGIGAAIASDDKVYITEDFC
jgi:uncharacterized protein YkwD